MLIKIIRFIKGFVRVRLIGYSPERFINLCSNRNILLWDLLNKGEEYEMCMTIQGFRQLKPILKKTRTKLVILDRHGLPFFLHKYRKRKMFFIGILCCIMLLYVVSLYIWDIHIEGNYTRTTDVLLDYLKEENINHGIKKSKIDCEEIETQLRSKFNDIIWASAEIKGTRLIIKLQENTDTVKIKAQENEPSDIIASKDGIITNIVTRSGVPLVGVGSVVKKGDILVLGRVDVLDDSGAVANYQYYSSDADIFIKSAYNYTDMFPMKYMDKKYTEQTKKSIYLRICNKKLNIINPKIPYNKFDILTDEYPLKLGENFYLPITFGAATVKEYVEVPKKYDKNGAKTMAESKLQEFCKKLMQKGVQIIENNVKIHIDENSCEASGKIQVIEKEGISVPTEKLTIPEPEERTENE